MTPHTEVAAQATGRSGKQASGISPQVQVQELQQQAQVQELQQWVQAQELRQWAQAQGPQ